MEERKDFTYDKAELRRILIERRKAVGDVRRRAAAASDHIMPLLRGRVMVYISMRSEMPTDKLIDRLLCRPDIAVYAPYTDCGKIVPKRLLRLAKPDRTGNLDLSCYGDMSEDIDVCVTPLVGFDPRGYRVGYGLGCYDRFFAERKTFKIGFAFDAQKAEFDCESHDVPLDCCVTESGVIYFNHARDIG